MDIFAAFQNDPDLAPPQYDPAMMINDRLTAAVTGGRSERLAELVAGWDLSDERLADGPTGWEKTLEEVGVLVTLLACATGRSGKTPAIDFFLVSLISRFLPIARPARRSGSGTE
jgi:hypothetical protein